MSTATSHLHTEGPEGPEDLADAPDPSVAPGPRPVVVRRNAGLAALVGAAASAVAIAYLWRATQSGAALDWAVCAVLAGIAAVHLAQLVDARTPLLVADELGVRVRLGHQWRGLPWDAVDQVLVQPARGPLRDGRLMFAPHSLGRALDGLDTRGRRAAALNQRRYGAALAVPLGLATRTPARGPALVAGLVTLAAGRSEVLLGESPETRRPRRRSRRAVEAEAPAGAAAEAATEAHPVADVLAMPGWSQPEAEPDTGVDEPADLAASEDDGDGDGVDEPVEGDAAESPARRRSLVGRVGTAVSRVGRGRDRDVDSPLAPADDVTADPAGAQDGGLVGVPVHDLGADVPREAAEAASPYDQDGHADDDEPTDTHEPGEPQPGRPAARPAARGALPLRDVRRSLRAQVRHGRPAPALGSAALLPEPAAGASALPEAGELRRASDPDDDRVRPISTLGEAVEPVVVDDFVTEPAYDPVIGPELAAARTRVGLSVDELAERTRIRPHVIESIEVDDFAPCGGDFYARGHLRTLARVLGRDPAPLLEQFEKRYATAPISARRVFEAELATGMTGSMRSTVGGPNWLLLVGVVLALVLTWGVVRLFSSEPTETLVPVPALNGSAGIAAPKPDGGPAVAPVARPLRVALVGAHAATRVVVRDRAGTVVWAGRIELGGRRTVRATPPVQVSARDAGAVEVTVAGVGQGTLGTLGAPGARSFTRADARPETGARGGTSTGTRAGTGTSTGAGTGDGSAGRGN